MPKIMIQVDSVIKIKEMSKIYHTLVLFLLLIITLQASKKPNPVIIDAVQKVYNQTWYSGYLDIKDTKLQNVTHHMHYFFFPSQDNVSSDPLLFWFNGGPGCSSLLGALYEHGPFLVHDAFGMLMYNKYSWNRKASVVYIESPSEVGFSYMDNKPKNYTWNDDAVAVLNRDAVLEFFSVFTEFKNRKTYIAGESYGGIYVPTLFEKLHDYNTGRKFEDQINIQGFAVGNGCTHETECEFLSDYGPYLMQLYRDSGFITSEMYNEVDAKCNNKKVLPDDCTALLDKIDEMMNGINIYDAYRPCYQNDQFTSPQKPSFKELRRLALRKRTSQNKTLSWAPPCVDSLGIDKLLLDKNVRANMSIPTFVQNYSMCNANDDFFYDRSLTGSYSIYKKLIPLNKYKIIVYSGDSDPAVPTSGTLFWVDLIRHELQLPTAGYFSPWFTTQADNGPQNAGNVWELANNFMLVTFKGIGHMAPQWNLEGGQKMIHNLLLGTRI